MEHFSFWSHARRRVWSHLQQSHIEKNMVLYNGPMVSSILAGYFCLGINTLVLVFIFTLFSCVHVPNTSTTLVWKKNTDENKSLNTLDESCILVFSQTRDSFDRSAVIPSDKEYWPYKRFQFQMFVRLEYNRAKISKVSIAWSQQKFVGSLHFAQCCEIWKRTIRYWYNN